MRIGVIGINHKLADLNLRELLAKACQKYFSPGCFFYFEHSLVLLSTCNRTEIYFSSRDLSETHTKLLSILRKEVALDFDQKLYSYFGYDCFLHLARVTAGLDSAVLAETEIQGQVKAAYLKASHYQPLSKEIHFLFQKALKTGKEVRSKLFLKGGVPSLEQAVLHIAEDFFPTLEEVKLLFVGASTINQKILNFLKHKTVCSISLCNRSQVKPAVRESFSQVKLVPWEELCQLDRFDWVIFGTKSPVPLLTPGQICQASRKKLVIDLGVPRNVHPALSSRLDLTVFNIDEIHQTLKLKKQKMQSCLRMAETKVVAAAKMQINLYNRRKIILKTA